MTKFSVNSVFLLRVEFESFVRSLIFLRGIDCKIFSRLVRGCMGRDAPFNAGFFSRVLGLPQSFGEFGSVTLPSILKALVMVVEAGFELRFTTTIIIFGGVV